MVEQPGDRAAARTGRSAVDGYEQEPERTEPLFAADWWAVPAVGEPSGPAATPALEAAPGRRQHAVRAAVAATGVAALLVGSAGFLLARSQPTLTSTALPGLNSTGTASLAASAASTDQVSAVSAAVVDIDTTLGNSGGRAAGTGIVLTSDGLGAHQQPRDPRRDVDQGHRRRERADLHREGRRVRRGARTSR